MRLISIENEISKDDFSNKYNLQLIEKISWKISMENFNGKILIFKFQYLTNHKDDSNENHASFFFWEK